MAKVSNLLASLHPGYPSYLGAVEVLNLGTSPLPVFAYLAFNPLALHRSINYCLLPQTNVCTCIMPCFSEGFIFFSVAREDQGK